MREILFRGQTRRYGEKVRLSDGKKLPSQWVYGGTLQGTGDFSIIYGGENVDDLTINIDKKVVYTDTLGQFTGLTDKHGKRIFEGDIVRATIERAEGCKSPRTENGAIGYDCIGMIGLILYKDKNGENVYSDFFNELSLSGLIEDYYFEVIGNIHDNPELLKGE